MNSCSLGPRSAQTRVLIVDDHYIIREGLTELLGQNQGFVVEAATGSAEEALEAAQKTPFDLAIVDISLGRMDGIELTQRLKAEHHELIVLIFSMHDEQVYVDRAMRAGASGYVTKQEAGDTLLDAIDAVLRGKQHFSSVRRLES